MIHSLAGLTQRLSVHRRPQAKRVRRHLRPQARQSEGARLQAQGLAQSSACQASIFNIPWPFSQLILAGVKTIETRTYALGHRNIAQPDVEMWLVETRAQEDALAKGWVLAGGAAVAPRPEEAQIVGTVTFSRSDKYESPAAFR